MSEAGQPPILLDLPQRFFWQRVGTKQSVGKPIFEHIPMIRAVLFLAFLVYALEGFGAEPAVICIGGKGNYAAIEGGELRFYERTSEEITLELKGKFFSVKSIPTAKRSLFLAFDGRQVHLVDLDAKDSFVPIWIPGGYECSLAKICHEKLILGLSPSRQVSVTAPIAMLDEVPKFPVVLELDLEPFRTPTSSLQKIKKFKIQNLKTLPGFGLSEYNEQAGLAIAFKDSFEEPGIVRDFVLLSVRSSVVIRRWRYSAHSMELQPLKLKTNDGDHRGESLNK